MSTLFCSRSWGDRFQTFRSFKYKVLEVICKQKRVLFDNRYSHWIPLNPPYLPHTHNTHTHTHKAYASWTTNLPTIYLLQAEPQIAMEIKRWEQNFRYLSVLDHVNSFNFQFSKFQKEHFFSVRSFAGMCAHVRKSALVVRTLFWAPNPQNLSNFPLITYQLLN